MFQIRCLFIAVLEALIVRCRVVESCRCASYFLLLQTFLLGFDIRKRGQRSHAVVFTASAPLGFIFRSLSQTRSLRFRLSKLAGFFCCFPIFSIHIFAFINICIKLPASMYKMAKRFSCT